MFSGPGGRFFGVAMRSITVHPPPAVTRQSFPITPFVASASAVTLAPRSISVQEGRARPNVTYKDPPRSDEQFLPVKDATKPITDHNLWTYHCVIKRVGTEVYLVPRDSTNSHLPHVNIVVVNMMMQGKERRGGFNNGLMIVEDHVQYLARIECEVKRLAEEYNKGKIDILLMQEAPVGEDIELVRAWFAKYLREDIQLELEGTDWGIMVAVNKNKFPNVMKNINITQEGVMKDRAATIEIPELNTTLITVHVPHGDSKSKAAVEAKKIIAQKMSNGLGKNIAAGKACSSLGVLGDWNGTEGVAQLASEVVNNLIPPETEAEFACEIAVATSHEGHMDKDKGLVTVDHGVMTCLHFKDEASLRAAVRAVSRQEDPMKRILGTKS
ncbi:MAG: hypothetical protein A3F18_03215 [Legionellales bacterium RIFCSPHIGHO2_12_FULL_37_14]|nr:MAG: hypothetical protein A3F18_03215 [Legionellales bacterium RIFCSPHIGHO2_12_FULL_37_14]